MLESTMVNTTEKLTLIEGSFSNEDARDILMNMFSNKMKFYKLKNYTSQIRFDKDDEIAKDRMSAMENEVAKLQKILAEASARNEKIVISSELTISLDSY